MSEQNRDARLLAAAAQRIYPTVRAVTFADINEAWAQGLRDFRAAPVYGLVFGGFYAAGGIVVVLGLSLRYARKLAERYEADDSH